PFTSTTAGGRARGRPEAGNLERAASETSCSSDSGARRELEDLGGERRQPRARRGRGPTGHIPAAAPAPSTSTTTGGRARGRPKAGNLGVLPLKQGASAARPPPGLTLGWALACRTP